MKYTTINIQGNLISEEILQKVEKAETQSQTAVDFGFAPGTNLKNEIEYAWSRIKLDWKNFSGKSQTLSVNDQYGTALSRKWMEQFLNSLGFDLIRQKVAQTGDNDQLYHISHTAENCDNLPVHLVGFTEPNQSEKNTLDIKTSGGTTRFSPHGIMQEYLNVTEHLYGIASNGFYLRLIRDTGRLIKLTYVEFDLKRMLDEDKYSEFTVLYRLLHVSRFPRTKAEIDHCLLEKYYQDSIETGNRIRDGLSLAVKESLVALGKGFLQHELNSNLRNQIMSGSLTPKDYYRQLLRIIYRLLFLMVTEERDLVYDQEDKSETAQRLKKIYLKFYSIARLRKLSGNRYLHEPQFTDLWQGLVNTFRLFEEGGNGTKLGILPLDGDLFSYRAIEDLQLSFINNKLLLECIYNLNEFEDEKKNLVPINYRSLDVEELGSVYEGLLELHPVIENIESINPSQINFTFHEGTDRKTTGSYYTRPELVNELIKSALIPVIEERLKEAANSAGKGDVKSAQEKALLKLKVCDAAAGSGHMLLAAARTIAWYLARVQSGEENPAPSVYRSCLREVIQHCIYAVDMNPDAVELCKLALWLEGHNSGKPLSFLDHKIRCGNSLVGVADLSVLKKGIPSEAFNPVTGDDKTVCSELKKENQKFVKFLEGRRDIGFQETLDFQQKKELTTLTATYHELEDIKQDDVAAVKKVRTQFNKLRTDAAWFKDWRACNIWTAAFFFNYINENQRAAPTSEALSGFLEKPATAYGPMLGKADDLSLQHKFFHWPLEFPDVFEQGGFDVMLGNPPWEALQLEEQQFFEGKDSNIVNASNKNEREILIESLKINNQKLYAEFIKSKHTQDCINKFIRAANRFQLTSFGKLNTDALFSELCESMTSLKGKASIIVPTAVFTDKSTNEFFIELMKNKRLKSFYGFINSKKIFRAVKDYIQFGIMTISNNEEITYFMYLLKDTAELTDNRRKFNLTIEDIVLLNPNTKTSAIFRTSIDCEITKKIYRKHKIINRLDLNVNPWKISLKQGLFNMSTSSKYFKLIQEEQHLPVYEAKLFHHYDHRYTTYEGATQANINEGNLPFFSLEMHVDPCKIILPKNWMSSGNVFNNSFPDIFKRKWYLTFRDVTGGNSERTSIFSIIPKSAIGNTAPIVVQELKPEFWYCLLIANFNSIAFDFITRQKIAGPHLNFFILNQIPLIEPEFYSDKLMIRIVLNVLELTYSSWDIKAFADDIWNEAGGSEKIKVKSEKYGELTELQMAIVKQWEENQAATGGHTWSPPEWCEIDPEGCPLPPFKWDENRRANLKAELDAIYAKLYGLTRDELR